MNYELWIRRIMRGWPSAASGRAAKALPLPVSWSWLVFHPQFLGIGQRCGAGGGYGGSGFDVWIPELRGHGRSPKRRGFSKITAEDPDPV
ncbi:MAG: hypothetical protein R2875_03850 [Desulfobacterales bacterium]